MPLEPPVHRVAEVLPRPRFTGAQDPEAPLTPRPRPSDARTITPFATAAVPSGGRTSEGAEAPEGKPGDTVQFPWTVGMHR
ncbi:MAG: hypothetical protein AAFQ51_05690 [Pseudomonadota bacterium]